MYFFVLHYFQKMFGIDKLDKGKEFKVGFIHLNSLFFKCSFFAHMLLTGTRPEYKKIGGNNFEKLAVESVMIKSF